MTVWKRPPEAPARLPQPALFLDRDGVVIRDRDYLADPAEVEVLGGVADAMRRARAAGFWLIGVSNQSGLGRGYFKTADFGAVMARLEAELAAADVSFDGFYYCPHAPRDRCQCRKPQLGLLAEAARSFTWDPARSWVIGDKVSDVALGQAGGLGSVLVRTGYGAQDEAVVRRRWSSGDRVLVADDLPQAVDLVLARLDHAEDGPP